MTDVDVCAMLVQPWRNLGVSLKDYMDSSVRSGKAYSGGDSSTKSGRQYNADTSARAGTVYNEKPARGGKVYNETSARGGKVYNDTSSRAGTVWDGTQTQTDSFAQTPMLHDTNGGYGLGQRTALAPIPSVNQRGQTSMDFQRNTSVDFGTSSKRVHKIAPL